MKILFTFEDTTKTSEVHLIGAVEYDDVFAECFTHVLCGLGFSCSGGTGRGASHAHVQGLSQGDVTPANYCMVD